MHVGLLRIRIAIPGAQSLKDRRRVLRSIKDRLKPLNVACAEIGDRDHWQTAELAIVTVTSDANGVDVVLGQAARVLERYTDAFVTDITQERL